jgi:hypothetical protein
MDKEYRTKERKASTSKENSGPAVYDGLRSIACGDCMFEFRRQHGCLRLL